MLVVVVCGKWKRRERESFSEWKWVWLLCSFNGFCMNPEKIGSHFESITEFAYSRVWERNK